MNKQVCKATRSLQFTLLARIAIMLSVFSAMSSLALAVELYEPMGSSVNNMPLFSWTNHMGSFDHYTLELSRNNQFSNPMEFSTSNTHYQTQQELQLGTWYWRVSVYELIGGVETLINTSIAQNFTIIEEPSFTVEVDTSQYAHNNKKVIFKLNTPQGSALSLRITRQNFELPFNTNNLQTESFNAILEEGVYDLEANFTYEGLTGQYTNSFTLSLPEIKEHYISFTITNEEGQALSQVLIELEGKKRYFGTTNSQGTWNKSVEEDNYDILVSHQGFIPRVLTRTVNKDQHNSITLIAEEQAQELLTTSSYNPPSITINSPAYRETVQAEQFFVNFTLSSTTNIGGCDLLIRKDGQQGWMVASFISTAEEENIIEGSTSEGGEHQIKIRCAHTRDSTSIESSTRSIIIQEDIGAYEPLQEFLSELDSIKTSIGGNKNFLYQSLGSTQAAALARSELLELEKEYYDSQGSQEVTQRIDKLMESYQSQIVKNFKLIEEEDKVIQAQAKEFSQRINTYLQEQNTQMQKNWEDHIAQQQENYILRSKIMLAEVQYMDGNIKYLTGITNFVQQLTHDQDSTEITIIESSPQVYKQRIGTPRILDEQGQNTGSIEEDYVLIRTRIGQSYTILYQGNVKSSLPQTQYVVIQELTEDEIQEVSSKGGVNLLTGRVVEAIEGTGIPAQGVLLGIIIGVIIAGLFYNPVYNLNDYKTNKKIRSLTENIHDIMDEFEQGNIRQAINKYPRVKQLYDKLPTKHQEDLGFAIGYLGQQTKTATIQEWAYYLLQSLPNIQDSQTFQQHISLTNWLYKEYSQLPHEEKQKLTPLIRNYHYNLAKKHDMFRQAHRQS